MFKRVRYCSRRVSISWESVRGSAILGRGGEEMWKCCVGWRDVWYWNVPIFVSIRCALFRCFHVRDS